MVPNSLNDQEYWLDVVPEGVEVNQSLVQVRQLFLHHLTQNQMQPAKKKIKFNLKFRLFEVQNSNAHLKNLGLDKNQKYKSIRI